MPKWNFVAMGQVGLTGWTREAAQPLARWIARRARHGLRRGKALQAQAGGMCGRRRAPGSGQHGD